MNINIRHEKVSDYDAITKINKEAFKQENEGELIKALRGNPDFVLELSLVAEVNGKQVGHILFYPIKIKSGKSEHRSLALAPMSVDPEYQRKGIGSKLIEKGLIKARKSGFNSVIVLGHPEYYPKFGFKPASEWNIQAPFDVPDEAFFAIELAENGLSNVSGEVEYPKEFSDV